MLLELIVAGVCLQPRASPSPDGCPSALQAYYVQNPRLGQIVKRQERYVRALPYGNFAFTYFLMPSYTVFVVKKVTIPVSRHFAFVTQFEDRTTILQFTYGY